MSENDGNKETPQHVCSLHSGVEANIGNIFKTMTDISGNITKLFEKFESLQNEFRGAVLEYAKRPGWTVTVVITTMGSIISVLATVLLYHLFGK